MEKRKFQRLHTSSGVHVTLYSAAINKEVDINDVSVGGMKVCLSKALDVGSPIFGEFSILPQGGPFYVRGKVVRVTPQKSSFETAIKFENVSTVQPSIEFSRQVSDILHQ